MQFAVFSNSNGVYKINDKVVSEEVWNKNLEIYKDTPEHRKYVLDKMFDGIKDDFDEEEFSDYKFNGIEFIDGAHLENLESLNSPDEKMIYLNFMAEAFYELGELNGKKQLFEVIGSQYLKAAGLLEEDIRHFNK